MAAAFTLLGVVATSVLTRRWQGSLHQPMTEVQVCEQYLGRPVTTHLSVIFTADPGEFSGTPEAHYIIANLRHRRSKPEDSTVCGGLHYHGTLMGQPVLVITTGIGPPAAGLCTLEVVSACGAFIKEILYFGTSGWSPQLGGVLNPPECHAANGNKLTARLGDVCVSPFTVNWTCKKSSWEQQAGGYPNQCYRPPEAAGPNATILYGECQFYNDNMAANLALADEVLSAAKSHAARRQQPARSPAVSSLEQSYWRLMSDATGVAYPIPAPDGAPTYWDYRQCMEVDGQFFWSGVPFEVKARDYVAQTLSQALGQPMSAADVLAVSAMEGIGVAEALRKYHALSTTKQPIPYTHIRTLANWLHQPVRQVSPGAWQTAEEVPEDFVTGYGYAIATGSVTILSVYHARCKEDVRQRRLPHGYDCSFTINYTTSSMGVPSKMRWLNAASGLQVRQIQQQRAQQTAAAK